MNKLDLSKIDKSYYTAPRKPELIKLRRTNFISILGKGDPLGKAFADKLQALYSTAYTLKFASKLDGKDFVVAKLEGLWSFDEKKFGAASLDEAPVRIPRSEWSYRMMIRLPDYIQKNDIDTAKKAVLEKKQIELTQETEFFTMEEGTVVQMLHVGPFATEPETLKIMKQFIDERGLKRNGLHHEIYLSDFRKTASDKLKTILREPVK